MPIIDQNLSSLTQITQKIRLLTSSIQNSQLTDQAIQNYINQFLLYDFSEHLRHVKFKRNFTFYTQPYVDRYVNLTDDSDASNPLYNFKNTYITFNPPLFIAGQEGQWVQSEQDFYNMYPVISSITSIGTLGNGSETIYSGVIPTSSVPASYNPVTGISALILKGSVLFESQDMNGLGLSLIDYPQANNNIIAPLAPVGFVGDLSAYPYGQINYITGAFNLDFAIVGIPAANAPINSQVKLTQPAMPQSVLFYGGEFRVMPVPDQVYPITMEGFIRPTALLAMGQLPELSEFWEYIAYGSSKKVFEDRRDFEGVQGILPEFTKQQNLIQRRTIVQNSNQRSSTLYAQQLDGYGFAGASFYNNGNFF